jgi:hypothetical protein
MFISHLNEVLTLNFLKMASIRVRFSPGFHSGAGFPGENSGGAALRDAIYIG